MGKNILTIEINDILTKICLVAKKSGGVNIIKSKCFETPPSCISDGQILNPELLGDTVMNALKQDGFDDIKGTIFSLASSKIVSRKIFLPPVNMRKLNQIIHSNAEDYFPIELTNYNVMHTVVEKVSGTQTGINVLVTAIPKSIISGYVKLAKFTNLQIESFDYNLTAQFELFKKINLQGTTMYINIGVKQSIATFMFGASMLLQRVIPFGGNELIAEVQRKSNIDGLDVLKALAMCQNPDIMAKLFDGNSFLSCVSGIVSGIEKAADMFKTTFKNHDIQNIVLLGDCGDFAGFKKAVGGEAKTLREIKSFSKAVFGKHATFNAVCAATLLNPLDKNAELVPSESKRKNNETKIANSRSAVIIMLFCNFAGILLVCFAVAQNYNVQNEIERKTKRLLELQEVQIIYDDYVLHGEIQNSLKTLESLAVNNSANLTSFLSEIEAKMPPELLLLSVTCDNYGVTLNVQTSTMAQAAVVLSRLRSFDSISEVSTSNLSETTNELGSNVTSFTVVCAYKPQSGEIVTDNENNAVQIN